LTVMVLWGSKPVESVGNVLIRTGALREPSAPDVMGLPSASLEANVNSSQLAVAPKICAPVFNTAAWHSPISIDWLAPSVLLAATVTVTTSPPSVPAPQGGMPRMEPGPARQATLVDSVSGIGSGEAEIAEVAATACLVFVITRMAQTTASSAPTIWTLLLPRLTDSFDTATFPWASCSAAAPVSPDPCRSLYSSSHLTSTWPPDDV